MESIEVTKKVERQRNANRVPKAKVVDLRCKEAEIEEENAIEIKIHLPSSYCLKFRQDKKKKASSLS